MDVGSAVDDGLNKISGLGKDLSILTGAAGFLYGVDSKWIGSNNNTSYPFSAQGLADAIASIFGKAMAHTIFPTLAGPGSGADKTFNLGAVMNKGTAAAIGLYLLKEAFPGKYTKLAYNVAFAPLLGYGIGRIFDDPQNPNYPGGSAPAQCARTGQLAAAQGNWADAPGSNF